jgi:hypothetical protein
MPPDDYISKPPDESGGYAQETPPALLRATGDGTT